MCAASRSPSDPLGEMRAPGEFAAFIGPDSIDGAIRQAIGFCRMMLPPGRRTSQNIAVEIRRIVERALANLEEDERRLGPPTALP